MPIVTLLTDFGTEDGYVGAMKGVLLSGLPSLQVVDISHDIEPFNLRQAAFALLNYAAYFPAGTVHLVVVDPGVGTSRSGLIVKTPDHYFIGPDNGVFSFIYESDSFEAYRILVDAFGGGVSPTFHGRDVFAPAAVRLLRQEEIGNFSEPVTHLASFYDRWKQEEDGTIVLRVIHIDHFGNIVLNFKRDDFERLKLPRNVKIQFKTGFLYGINKTFGDVPTGRILALWDSSGFLQISQNKGNAARTLKMKVGDEVLLKP